MSPLPKTLVPLDFTQGVDTKSDDKLGAKPATLENGIFGEKKSLTRRPGHSLVADISASIGTDSLLCSREGQILVRDRTKLRGRASNGSILDYGNAYQFVASKRPLLRGNIARSCTGQAAVSGVVGVTWNEFPGSICYFTTLDDSTGLPFIPAHVSLGTIYTPTVVAASDRVCCIYSDGTNVKMTYALVATPTTTSTVTLRTDAGTSGGYNYCDAVTLPSGNIAVAYSSSAGGIRLVTVNTSGTLQAGPVSIAETLVDSAGFHVQAFSGGNIAVIWCANIAGPFRYAVYTSALGAVSAAANLTMTGLTAATGFVTSVADSSNSLYVFANAYVGASRVVFSGVVASTGTISTAFAVFVRAVFISAAPFIHNSRVFLPTTQTAANGGLSYYEQPTIQVLERLSTGAVRVAAVLLRSLSAISAANSPGGFNKPAQVRTRTRTDGTWPVLILPEKGRPALNSFDTTVQGFAEFELREDVAGFDVERTRLAPVEYGHSLYFPGSTLRQFDGAAIYEAGFLQFPGPISMAQSGAAGLANGTYLYCVVWEWVDAQGQLHRSAPSIPVSFTVTGGPRNVTVTIPSIYATEKNLTAVVYRTVASGTTFYRVNGAGDLSNNPAAASFTYVDTSTDATISAREILYTTAELENTCPPASVFAHTHQRRMFLVCAEDRFRIAYTDEQEEGFGPTFNEAYEIDCGPEYGGIVGLGSIDDKLILLRQTGLQFIAGSGPDRQGLQNTFTSPQFITSDTGCVSAASIVQTPDGLMFKGERGLYLLNRGLQLTWVGEEVESLTGRVACATLVAKRTQVRFSCPENSRVVTFDYANGQWSIFTGLQFDGMAVVDSVLYVLTRAEALWSENAAAAGDNSTAFSMVVVTPWVKASGTRGVQRVYRALLLGEIEGFSTVTLEIGYDFSDQYESAVSVDTSLLGAVDEALLARRHLDKQKCEAIRFRITCNGANSGVASLGAALSNLTLEVGGKRGARKLPPAQTI
jgi:hypothetical protein